MHIRIATEADITEMHRIRLSVLENRLADPVRIRPEDYRAMLLEHGRGWVAEVEGRIAGFGVADLARSNIWALFVDPVREGGGIGRKLHAEMLDWLFESGVARVWLCTDRGTRAEQFYRTAGWAFTGVQADGEIRFEMSQADWRAPSTKPHRPPFT